MELLPPRLVPSYQGEVTDDKAGEKFRLSISSQEGQLATTVHPRPDQEEMGGWGLETESMELAGGLGVGK